MSFLTDNSDYESWLRTRCEVVEADLDYKHKRMAKNAFVFLRATYFRWAKRIETLCSELKDAPRVLSVGDMHTENFGTWRDAEGRLVWGVNDFDEAAIIPYSYDLVRLATSAQLAPTMDVGESDPSAAIIDGYVAGLTNPRPMLLDEGETSMRPFISCTDDDRRKFWKELDDYPPAMPPTKIEQALIKSLPEGISALRYASRVKGGGSLGRPRYVAIAQWQGGRVIREAKALVSSAWDWAHDAASTPPRFLDVAEGRFRSPDPFMKVHDGFVLRRITADTRKIEFGDSAVAGLKLDLLRAMGRDLGSIHAAEESAAREISSHLKARSPDWLRDSLKITTESVEEDFKEWSQFRRSLKKQ
jgi:hypothetical protein